MNSNEQSVSSSTVFRFYVITENDETVPLNHHSQQARTWRTRTLWK